jgi:hypothetical protein
MSESWSLFAVTADRVERVEGGPTQGGKITVGIERAERRDVPDRQTA